MQLKHLNQPSQELSTSCEHKIKESQPLKPNYFAHIARSLGNLSIRDKISSGYALALCVAIAGTTVGMLAGNHYYRRTNNQVHIDRESQLLNKLQVALLRMQNSQEGLIYWIEKPQLFNSKYGQLQNNIYNLKLLLSDAKNPKYLEDIEGIEKFRQTCDLLSNYINRLEIVNKKISKLPNNPAQQSVKRKLLSNLDRDKIGLQLDRAVNDIAEIIDR